ncbi:MAG: DinB family protein [Alphaproteobacteria bacterium]|nr:DinB family protein [Alphaproteobacteria bacterium]
MNKEYFIYLAHYNHWANNKLYQTCGELSLEEIAKERPAFFKSILGTLNHLFVANKIWLDRFSGQLPNFKRLDLVLFNDFLSLKNACYEQDDCILKFMEKYQDKDFSQKFNYKNMAGESKEIILGYAITHFFNHQTHHRGQIHNMLMDTPIQPPELDQIYFYFER